MQFVVPQFIEVEDKIVGPLSVRQFLIFLVGFGIIFILFKLLSFVVFIIAAMMVFALTGIFAFAKINGQAFHYFFLNIIYTIKRPHLKVWQKEITSKEIAEVHRKETIKTTKVIPAKKIVTSSKLAQLSLVVDTGGAYKEEEDLIIKSE